MKKNSIKREIKDLLHDGNYDIRQQINDENEEMYEGCEDNIMMVLESGETTIMLLPESDPHARPGCKTYSISYSTYIGLVKLYIWEI